MVPVCDKRYHKYNRFRHFWAEIKKLWNYPLTMTFPEFYTCSTVKITLSTNRSSRASGTLSRAYVCHGILTQSLCHASRA